MKKMSPTARETRRDFMRRTATRAGRTPSVPNALVASFKRVSDFVSDVRLANMEFCYFSTRPVRVSLIRYCVTDACQRNRADIVGKRPVALL